MKLYKHSRRNTINTLAVNGIQHYAAYGDPFGFTGKQTDANGLVYLRARHYAPSLGIFPSLDPFEGDPGRPMSLNGYSWVEGNTPNMGDPSGMCIEINVCDELRRNGASGQQLLVAGCLLSGNTPCCGPDATEWIYKEMVNHYQYVSTELFQAISPETSWIEKVLRTATGFYAGWDLGLLMLYGLAVDYKRVNYQFMAFGEALAQGRTARMSEDYSCNNTRVITVCGRCQDASDYGNFFIGMVLNAAGEARASATSAGIIFNLLTRDYAGLPIDTRGVEVGYDIAGSSEIKNGGSFNRDSFCNLMRSQYGWYDLREMMYGGDCLTACSECYSSVNQSPNSYPYYNGYVSQTLVGGSPQFARPVDELLELFTRAFGSNPLSG